MACYLLPTPLTLNHPAIDVPLQSLVMLALVKGERPPAHWAQVTVPCCRPNTFPAKPDLRGGVWCGKGRELDEV